MITKNEKELMCKKQAVAAMNPSFETDRNTNVLIVGGGPAGLSAAESAAGKTSDVLVLEKSPEIGYPIHTSGASYVQDMDDLGVPPRLYHTVNRLVFYSPNESAEFQLSKRSMCVLDVRGCYQYLAERAIAAGARVNVSSNVLEPIIRNGSVYGVKAVSKGRQVSFTSKVTIDASGFSGALTRVAGLGKSWSRVASGVEYDAWIENLPSNDLIFLVGKKYAPAGYAWIFPTGEKRARIGVGITKPEAEVNTLQYLDRLVEERPPQLTTLGRIVPIELHFGSTPVDGPILPCTMPGLLAAGDSAGHLLAQVGEGIRFAMIMGRKAGESAAKIANGDEFARLEYEKESEKLAKRSLNLSLKVQKRLAGFTDEEWDKAVRMVGKISGDEFLQLLKGDFSKTVIMKLVAKNPFLLASSTFSMVKRALGVG